jgi:hypothetical protein
VIQAEASGGEPDAGATPALTDDAAPSAAVAAAATKRAAPAKPPPPKQHQRGPSMKIAPSTATATAPAKVNAPPRPKSSVVTIAEEPTSALKEGMLFKKAMGKSKLGKSNWKMRFFSLSAAELAYYDSYGGASTGAKKKGAVALGDVSAVKLAPSTTKANTFIVIVGSKELQIQAATKAEADDWMVSIKAACGLA